MPLRRAIMSEVCRDITLSYRARKSRLTKSYLLDTAANAGTGPLQVPISGPGPLQFHGPGPVILDDPFLSTPSAGGVQPVSAGGVNPVADSTMHRAHHARRGSVDEGAGTAGKMAPMFGVPGKTHGGQGGFAGRGTSAGDEVRGGPGEAQGVWQGEPPFFR